MTVIVLYRHCPFDIVWRRLQSWLLVCFWIEAVDCGRCDFHFENFSVCHIFKRGRSPVFLLSVTHLHDNFSEFTHHSCMCHIYCYKCVVIFVFYIPKINIKLWVMCILRVFLVSAEFISWFIYTKLYVSKLREKEAKNSQINMFILMKIIFWRLIFHVTPFLYCFVIHILRVISHE